MFCKPVSYILYLTIPLIILYLCRAVHDSPPMRKLTFRAYHLYSLLLLVFGSFSAVVSACHTDSAVVSFLSSTKQTVDLTAWEIPNHATTPVELFERSELTDAHGGHRVCSPVLRLRPDWCDLSVPVLITFLPVTQQLFLRFQNLRH